MINYKIYIFGSLLLIIIILLVITLIYTINEPKSEHEFISDLTSIKIKDNSLFTDAICAVSYCKHNSTSTSTEPICKVIKQQQAINLPTIFLAFAIVFWKFFPNLPIKQNSYCNKLNQKQYNDLKSIYSFTKLEASQIYNNNKAYINYIYGNTKGKQCIKKFISLFDPIFQSNNFNNKDIESLEEEQFNDFYNCYKNLDSINKKYIDIVIINMFKIQILDLLF